MLCRGGRGTLRAGKADCPDEAEAHRDESYTQRARTWGWAGCDGSASAVPRLLGLGLGPQCLQVVVTTENHLDLVAVGSLMTGISSGTPTRAPRVPQQFLQGRQVGLSFHTSRWLVTRGSYSSDTASHWP